MDLISINFFVLDFSVFQQLGVALALGTLIGLERERKNQLEGRRDTYGGIRTYALIGLLGALAYMLSVYSMAFFIVISVGIFALIVSGYILTGSKFLSFGMTSEVASVLVYILGVFSAMKMYVLATAVALVVLLILFFKQPLHKLAKKIEERELISTLQFMIIAFVILPLLPNQAFGPYDFFNPYLVWLMVVFISGISFVSYIAIKWLGAKRGILATGFLAGFISTTALSFSFSGDSKKNTGIVNPYVLAMVVAGSAMFFRILIEVAVINSDLMRLLMLPILTMGFVGLLCGLFLFWKTKKEKEIMEQKVVDVKSPFSLWPALKFGTFFAIILFVSKFAGVTMGNSGLYLTSFFSGLLDVDAITISMSNLAHSEISKESAVIAITIAAVTNTLVKGGVFLLFGSRKVALKIVSVFGLMSLFGVLSLFFIQ